MEGPRPAGRPRPSADPGLRGSALAGEEAVTKDEEGETEETGSRRKVARGNHQVFSRLVAARWGCRGRPGNALRGALLSLRRLMEPSSLSLGSAAAAATAVPGLAQHSPASSSLHSSAPPVLPASRTPSPRPLPAQDARGHLFTASASDSPVQRRWRPELLGALPVETAVAFLTVLALLGCGHAPGLTPTSRYGPAPSTFTSGCGLARTSEHGPAPSFVLTSGRL